MDGFLVPSCILNNLQTALSNAVFDVLGEGETVSATKNMSLKEWNEIIAWHLQSTELSSSSISLQFLGIRDATDSEIV